MKLNILSLFVGLSIITSQAMAGDVNGVLQVVKGDVQIKSAKDGTVSKAKIGSKVFPKDTIITGKDARAKIVMVDNNVINVSPETSLEIKNYEFQPEVGKKDVLLNVLYGKVRSKVEQKYDGKTTKFQVKTPTAVAGVRGTDFMASYTPSTNTSSVVTFEGQVQFGQPGPGGTIQNPIPVNPGQMSEAKNGQAPPPAQPLPPQQLAQMDSESKSDAPAGNKDSGDARTPAGKNEGDKDKEKKDEDKKSADGEKKQGEGDKKSGEGDKKSGDGEKKQGDGDKKTGDGKSSANGTSGGSAPKAGAPTAGGATAGAANVGSSPGASESSAPATKGPDVGAAGPAPSPNGPANAPAMPAGPDTGRSPANAMPSMTGMLLPADFAGAPTSNVMPSLGAVMPALPPPIPQPPQTPVCDFCNRVIQDGNNTLIITVTH